MGPEKKSVNGKKKKTHNKKERNVGCAEKRG